MTATYKTKVRMAQQYQQAVQLKQVTQETLKVLRDCDKVSQETLKVLHDCNIREPDKRLPTRNMPSMGTEWKILPFAFPVTEGNSQKAEKINDILMFSLRQQKEDEVTDNTGFVTIVISRCLNAVGVSNQVDFGYRHIMDASLPHMWLVIDGYIIDNTYIKELQSQSTKYLCKNTPKCYKSCDCFKLETHKLKSRSHSATDTFEIASIITKTCIDLYVKHPDKALALGLNKEQSFNYYFSMIRHMYDIYGVSIVGIDPKIRSVCWHCDCYPKSGRNFLSDIVRPSDFKETNTSSKITWKFSHCSRCMVANYCSVECQKADWLDNHIINCFSRGSVYLPPIGDLPFMSDSV